MVQGKGSNLGSQMQILTDQTMMGISLCPPPSSLTPDTVSKCPHSQMFSPPLLCGSQSVSCMSHQTSVTPCADSSGRCSQLGESQTSSGKPRPTSWGAAEASAGLCGEQGAGTSQPRLLCAQPSGGPGTCHRTPVPSM